MCALVVTSTCHFALMFSTWVHRTPAITECTVLVFHRRLSITGLVEVQNLNRTSVFVVFPALDDLRRETRRLDVLRSVSARATDHMVPRCVPRGFTPLSGLA